MPKKKGKAVSFDAMVKFFMQHYGIPTKQDVEKLMARLDRLEHLIVTMASANDSSVRSKVIRRKSSMTAFETVFDIIKRSKQGLGFADIQARTGFPDKKIRNIIFRLHKIGKIKRLNRGTYVAE